MSQKRQAGYMEMVMKMGADFWGTANFPAVIQVRGPLTPELVGGALELLRKRHPALRAFFSESDRKVDYLELDDAPGGIPINVTKRTGDEQWKEFVELNMRKQFAADERHLWRVDMLFGGDGNDAVHEVVATFHHAICDARAAVTFFWELLDLCSRISGGEQPEIETLPFLPALEDMFKKKRGWGSWISWAVPRYAVYPAIRSAGSMLRYESPVPIAERRSRNIYRETGEERLSVISNACLREKVTLQGLLTAAAGLAAYRLVKCQHGSYASSIMTPVDCRGHCSPVVGGENMGCFMIFVPTLVTLSERTSLWELARAYSGQLKEVTSKAFTPYRYSKPVAKACTDSPNHGLFKNKFVVSVPVSNIGRIDKSPTVGPFHVKRFNFSVSHDWGDSIAILYAATLDNRLYCTFCYQEPLIERSTVESLVDDAMSILDSVS